MYALRQYVYSKSFCFLSTLVTVSFSVITWDSRFAKWTPEIGSERIDQKKEMWEYSPNNGTFIDVVDLEKQGVATNDWSVLIWGSPALTRSCGEDQRGQETHLTNCWKYPHVSDKFEKSELNISLYIPYLPRKRINKGVGSPFLKTRTTNYLQNDGTKASPTSTRRLKPKPLSDLTVEHWE